MRRENWFGRFPSSEDYTNRQGSAVVGTLFAARLASAHRYSRGDAFDATSF